MTNTSDPKLEHARQSIRASMEGLNADILEMDNIEQIQELSRQLKSVSWKLKLPNFLIRLRIFFFLALILIGLTIFSVVIIEGFRSTFGEGWVSSIGLLAATAPWYFCFTNRKVDLHFRDLVGEKNELTHELSRCKGELQLAQFREKELRATLQSGHFFNAL